MRFKPYSMHEQPPDTFRGLVVVTWISFGVTNVSVIGTVGGTKKSRKFTLRGDQKMRTLSSSLGSNPLKNLPNVFVLFWLKSPETNGVEMG